MGYFIDNELLNNPEDIKKQINAALRIDKSAKISGVIFETKNYENLKRLNGNRPLNDNNVKKLKKSFETNGINKSKPVITDKDGNILDGEHRKEASIQMNLPVFFAIEDIHNNSLELAIRLNSVQENWKVLDFVKSYAELGIIDYKNLLNLVQDEGITLSLAIWLLYRTRNGDMQSKIKSGDIKCSSEDVIRVKNILRKIREIRDVIPNNFKFEKEIRKYMMREKLAVPIMTLMNEHNYDHSRMVKQVGKRYDEINCKTMFGAGMSLVKIYNFRLGINSEKRLRDYKYIGKEYSIN